MRVSRLCFRCFLLSFCGIFTSMLLIGISVLVLEDETYGYFEYLEIMGRNLDDPFHDEGHHHTTEEKAVTEHIPYPIFIWWYRFTGEHTVRACGNVKCFFTNDRHYFNHSNTKVFMFYGTSWSGHDLPFPRKPHHEWALLHEESPKNEYLYSHKEIMELFNHTATFKRESDYPITTIWLKDAEAIETKQYLVPVEQKTKYLSELALINYVQSDCDCPSDRDHFVQMLQRHIKVDSYGTCEHNKELPEDLRDPLEGMMHDKFMHIVAKYKFTLVAENGVCDDYITEKLWRTLTVGSVPVIIGSKKIRDFLPDNHSAIIVDDFKSMKDLVDLLIHLNHSDHDYNKYLEYKHKGVTNKILLDALNNREWGADNPTERPNFVTATECFICQRIHENIRREKQGLPTLKYQASVEHYGCPRPLVFKDSGANDLERVVDEYHAIDWMRTKFEARALKEFWDKGIYNFTNYDVAQRMTKLRYEFSRQ